MNYIDAIERMNVNIAFASNDPRASRDTARMVETGVKKLCQLYTKLIAEGSSGAPPSGSGIQPPGFPSHLFGTLDPLVAALRALPLPATHPSHPAAPAILKTLTEAQKGYGEMRGAFCKKCLEVMGGRRIIDRIEMIPGIQGGKEIGVWIEGITAVAESEYQLLGRLAPLPSNTNIQPTFSTLLAPLVTMTSTTFTHFITLIKGSLSKHTFLALAAYEALGNVQLNWSDVVHKTGRKEDEVKDSVNSLRAVCLRSFPEFLLDVRAAGTKTNVEVGTGLHEITTLATSYLSQIPEVMDAVGSALVTLGDGMWKMGEGAGKVFGKSDQDDERVVIEHFICSWPFLRATYTTNIP
jgi:exocyst complex protein 7